MEKILSLLKANKYRAAYIAITALIALTAILAISVPSLSQAGENYNAFSALSKYLEKGVDQGFASLGTAAFTFLPVLLMIPSLVFAIIGIVKNKPGKLMYGILVPAFILEIVWIVLLNNNREWGLQTFFDMTLTCTAGAGMYLLTVFTGIILAGMIAYGIFQRKWGKAEFPELYAWEDELVD